MIYLDNNTQQQECWIPRQDILSGHSGGGGGGSYQEGYNDGVAHQKSLLATTAFTQNGEYTRLNGWSGVSVNVPQTGSTARLEEKTVVISADTTNVHPSSGFDGMSAVTVDAEAYAQENYDSGFDDGFNDGISSGYTEGYDSGFTSGYTSGYTSGSTDGFQSGYTSGETVGYNSGYTFGYGDGYADGSIDGYNNGYPDGYNSGYTSGYSSGYTVGFGEGEDRGYEDGIIDGRYEVEQTFTSMTATTNGQYGSSANPLSSITVNVPTGSSETDIIIVTTGACWFTTNYQIDYGDSIEIEHCTFGRPILPYPGTHQQYVGGNSNEVFRIGQNEYGLYLKYFSNFYSGGHIIYFPSSGSILEDNTITFSSTGFTVDGNVVTSYTTTEFSSIATLIFFANNSSGVDVVEKQTAKMGKVKVYAPDGTLKATFEPRLDNLNVPYFKYVEQDIDIYASGSGTPLYEILDPMYNSGYTDGYTRGYTDGSASIASFIDRSITNVVIPSSVTSIGTLVFYNCRSLTSVTIPNSITSIGSYLFYGCISLTEVNIGSGVTNISSQAFGNCTSLTNIYISATTPPTISNANAFQGVPSTGTVHYPQGSDYSSWQSNQYLSGWTFIADL